MKKASMLLPFFWGNSRESGKVCCYCRFRVNPSPCQGHGGENIYCFIALTVENPEMIIATAVFEYFPAQIAVAGTGFTGFYCHQPTEVR